MYKIVPADGLRPLPPRPDLAHEENRARELMSATRASTRIPLKPEDVRPLPPRPDIDWERKRARKLVRMSGEKLLLDEARMLIARGYGFDSWQKMERYYADWELHNRVLVPQAAPLARAEAQVQNILREFDKRQEFTVQPPDISGRGASLCRYVPRFYGLSDQEIFSSTLTVEDAQLVVARGWRFDTWEALRVSCLNYVETERYRPSTRPDQQIGMPPTLASMANGATDHERITRLFTDDRRMFKPVDATLASRRDWVTWKFLIAAIAGLPDPLSMLNWIRELGVDVQGHLNVFLLGNWGPSREPLGGASCDLIKSQEALTRTLLDWGADPHWVAPNGYSVLEHAVVLYGSGPAVDLVAQRVPIRKAFWIAAGVGDVAMLQSFFKPNGDLSHAAHRDRADFSLIGNISLSGWSRPYASELHIMWEAFMLAVMNSRIEIIVALLDRGLPVDITPGWATALHYCIKYQLDAVAQTLLSRGANPDFKAWPDQHSAREMAHWWLQQFPGDATAQLIYNRRAAA